MLMSVMEICCIMLKFFVDGESSVYQFRIFSISYFWTGIVLIIHVCFLYSEMLLVWSEEGLKD